MHDYSIELVLHLPRAKERLSRRFLEGVHVPEEATAPLRTQIAKGGISPPKGGALAGSAAKGLIGGRIMGRVSPYQAQWRVGRTRVKGAQWVFRSIYGNRWMFDR
jgi:hypothetical protein